MFFFDLTLLNEMFAICILIEELCAYLEAIG